MDRVLVNLNWTVTLVYFDYVAVYSNIFGEYVQRLSLVLDALSNANIRLNHENIFFYGFDEVMYYIQVAKKKKTG